MLSFNMDEISILINDVNLITKVKFDLYDKDFNILHGDNMNMCSFCTLVRTCPECHKKCIESDREGFFHSNQTARVYTYKCHMGLTETVTPIICDGQIVGYLMMGQKLMREDYERVKRNIDLFPDESKRVTMLEMLDKMKYTSREELDAMCNLVEMCASYLHMKKLIKFRETSAEVLLKEYVRRHIADELDIKRLCREFKMSKSSLYLLSRSAFGKGITEYIRDARMETAKELLASTDWSVSTVAEKTGYSDSNYFTKAFKKNCGCTPSAWRKQNSIKD